MVLVLDGANKMAEILFKDKGYVVDFISYKKTIEILENNEFVAQEDALTFGLKPAMKLVDVGWLRLGQVRWLVAACDTMDHSTRCIRDIDTVLVVTVFNPEVAKIEL